MDLPKGFGGNAATPLAHMMADYQTPSPESTALFRAALAGSKHGVEESIKNGAKVNYFHRPEDFKNALHVASEGGFEDVCSVLIQNGAIIDDLAVSNKDSALILASKSGHANVVHLLLEANADVHVKNAYGNTPLHAACTEGYVEVANALIDAGSNIAAVNNKGSTCLHLFCLGDNEKEYPLDMLKMLIKSGGSDVINAKDSRGVTPLIAACGSGREDVCAYLLDHGANGNDIDNSGMTGVDTAKFQSKKLSSKILDQMARK